MATVYLRNGIYYAKFVDENGTRTSRNTGVSRKREAQRVAAGMEADALELRRNGQQMQRAYAVIVETAAREAQTGDLTLARSEEHLRRLRALANPSFKEISVDECFSEWIEAQRPHVANSTILSYEDARRRMTEALGKAKANGPVNELTSEDVRKALEKVAKKVKAATANMDLAALRRVLESACGEGLLTSNVAKPVRPLPTTDSVERAPFTAEEVRTLIDEASTEEWKGLILIAAHTGLRMGDVVSLTRDNVEGNDIIIRPSKTLLYPFEFGTTKPDIEHPGGGGGYIFPRNDIITLGFNFFSHCSNRGRNWMNCFY